MLSGALSGVFTVLGDAYGHAVFHTACTCYRRNGGLWRRAHEWGRKLSALGHQVKLLAPKSVRPFVQRNKTDAADAKAIWTAVQQPEARTVALKTEHQQVILALHCMREQLMKFRIMQTNALRGILYEFGIVLPAGYPALTKAWAHALPEARSPAEIEQLIYY
jgi:transposase